jgi:hypothetical protein
MSSTNERNNEGFDPIRPVVHIISASIAPCEMRPDSTPSLRAGRDQHIPVSTSDNHVMTCGIRSSNCSPSISLSIGTFLLPEQTPTAPIKAEGTGVCKLRLINRGQLTLAQINVEHLIDEHHPARGVCEVTSTRLSFSCSALLQAVFPAHFRLQFV